MRKGQEMRKQEEILINLNSMIYYWYIFNILTNKILQFITSLKLNLLHVMNLLKKSARGLKYIYGRKKYQMQN